MFSKNCVEENAGITNRFHLSRGPVFECVRLASRYLTLCFKINQERRTLARLTNMELQDIGLHPADVYIECKRSFFDIPVDRWHQQLQLEKKHR